MKWCHQIVRWLYSVSGRNLYWGVGSLAKPCLPKMPAASALCTNNWAAKTSANFCQTHSNYNIYSENINKQSVVSSGAVVAEFNRVPSALIKTFFWGFETSSWQLVHVFKFENFSLFSDVKLSRDLTNNIQVCLLGDRKTMSIPGNWHMVINNHCYVVLIWTLNRQMIFDTNVMLLNGLSEFLRLVLWLV